MTSSKRCPALARAHHRAAVIVRCHSLKMVCIRSPSRTSRQCSAQRPSRLTPSIQNIHHPHTFSPSPPHTQFFRCPHHRQASTHPLTHLPYHCFTHLAINHHPTSHVPTNPPTHPLLIQLSYIMVHSQGAARAHTILQLLGTARC